MSALIATAGAGGAGGATTSGINTTGANLIVLNLTTGQSSAAVSDNMGNTYTPLTRIVSTSPQIQLFYCVSPTVGAGHTFTYSVASSFSFISAAAFSGAITSGTFDQQNGFDQTSNVNSIQAGSITPGSNNEIIIAGVGGNVGASSYSIDSGFTILQQTPYGTTYAHGFAYIFQSTAAAINPTWSWPTLGTQNVATIASFKGTPSGGGGGTQNNKWFSLGGL